MGSTKDDHLTASNIVFTSRVLFIRIFVNQRDFDIGIGRF